VDVDVDVDGGCGSGCGCGGHRTVSSQKSVGRTKDLHCIMGIRILEHLEL